MICMTIQDYVFTCLRGKRAPPFRHGKCRQKSLFSLAHDYLAAKKLQKRKLEEIAKSTMKRI